MFSPNTEIKLVQTLMIRIFISKTFMAHQHSTHQITVTNKSISHFLLCGGVKCTAGGGTSDMITFISIHHPSALSEGDNDSILIDFR